MTKKVRDKQTCLIFNAMVLKRRRYFWLEINAPSTVWLIFISNSFRTRSRFVKVFIFMKNMNDIYDVTCIYIIHMVHLKNRRSLNNLSSKVIRCFHIILILCYKDIDYLKQFILCTGVLKKTCTQDNLIYFFMIITNAHQQITGE